MRRRHLLLLTWLAVTLVSVGTSSPRPARPAGWNRSAALSTRVADLTASRPFSTPGILEDDGSSWADAERLAIGSGRHATRIPDQTPREHGRHGSLQREAGGLAALRFAIQRK